MRKQCCQKYFSKFRAFGLRISEISAIFGQISGVFGRFLAKNSIFFPYPIIFIAFLCDNFSKNKKIDKNFFEKKLQNFLHAIIDRLDNSSSRNTFQILKLLGTKEKMKILSQKKVKIGPLLAKFWSFLDYIWPNVKFRAFLGKISCPKFSKSSSAN